MLEPLAEADTLLSGMLARQPPGRHRLKPVSSGQCSHFPESLYSALTLPPRLQTSYRQYALAAGFTSELGLENVAPGISLDGYLCDPSSLYQMDFSFTDAAVANWMALVCGLKIEY